MKYNILIEESAENDIDSAFLWYELQKKGLGFKFIDTINDSFSKIQSNPNSYPLVYVHFRKIYN